MFLVNHFADTRIVNAGKFQMDPNWSASADHLCEIMTDLYMRVDTMYYLPGYEHIQTYVLSTRGGVQAEWVRCFSFLLLRHTCCVTQPYTTF